MSQQTITANAIVLTNASQWHNWISIVKANAKQAKIWDLIDPSQETEPPHTEPTLPKKSNITGDNELTRSDTYADLMAQFNIDYRKHQEKCKTLIHTLAAIQKSVSPDYLTYIIDKDTPWQALRALQQAIEPHSTDRLLEIDRQYKTLCSGPPRGANLRQWLNKWEKIYIEAQAIQHADIGSGLILNYFIASLKQTDPSWASTSLYDLQLKRRNNQTTPSFMDLLNMFRQTSTNNLLSPDSSSAFAATLQGRTPDSRGSNSRTPSPTPPCVCGKQHWFNDCFYLMESKRPHGWKPNTEIMKKVEEALKNPILRGKVEKARQREKRYQERFQASASQTSASKTHFALRLVSNQINYTTNHLRATGTSSSHRHLMA